MRKRLIEFVQEMHCCGDVGDAEAHAKLELHDGGGGEYLVLNAREWSFNDAAEVDKFAQAMKDLLAEASS